MRFEYLETVYLGHLSNMAMKNCILEIFEDLEISFIEFFGRIECVAQCISGTFGHFDTN